MSSKVYFVPLADGLPEAEQANAIRKLFELSEADKVVDANDFVAITACWRA